MNGVKSPKIVVVALGRDDGECPKYGGKPAGEFVGSSNVSGEDGDNVFARGVDANDGWVRVFRLRARGDGPHADAESADEDESFVKLAATKAGIESMEVQGFSCPSPA